MPLTDPGGPSLVGGAGSIVDIHGGFGKSHDPVDVNKNDASDKVSAESFFANPPQLMMPSLQFEQ